MHATHISLLGGFSIRVAGEPADRGWRLTKAKTLVKLLALAPRHRLHRDQVVEILWPGTDVRTSANNLHQVVHTVRRTVGAGAIELNHDTVQLGPDGGLCSA